MSQRICVDTKILVDEDVSHAGDLFPIFMGMLCADMFRHFLGGLADHLQVADDSVACFCILGKGLQTKSRRVFSDRADGV